MPRPERSYVVNAGGWYGLGWYWNRGFGMYSFIPGDGILYSPFGWGFYSPAYIWSAPVYVRPYRYYGGYYGGGRVVTGTRAPRAVMPSRSFSSTPMQSGAMRSTPGSLGGGRRR